MPYARTSLRAEKGALRDKMRALGLGYQEIAAEFARRYRLRPRAARREAYGWSLKDAAARINSYTGEVGLDPGGIAAMTGSHLCEYENWPGPGPSPAGRRPSPYLLALLASVYGCAVRDLIDLDDRDHLPTADLLVLDKYGQLQPQGPHGTSGQGAPARPAPGQDQGRTRPGRLELRQAGMPGPPAGPSAGAPAGAGAAYLWKQAPGLSGPGIEREVLMAAHHGSEHAEQAERRDIGDATLEQLRADVIRLSREFMTGEPFPLFLEMRRVRARMFSILDRQVWPGDQADLYFLLAVLNGLMAMAGKGLGYPQAAEELIRAAWAYATVIRHPPLLAQLRLNQAGLAYGQDRFRQARDLALGGLEYLPGGPNAAQLHLKYGQAAARLGDGNAARRAITAAAEARERDHADELLEIGGEFDFSRASQHYLAGAALTEIPGAGAEAATELERAAEMYAAGPAPGESHKYSWEARTRTDLAAVRLRAGHLDAATAAIEPVLALPAAKRTAELPKRLTTVRAELARPIYHGSAQARDLDQQIEDFSRDTIATALHELPAGPG